mmetsp:Transcript_19821/g.57879  ORF Transcript_19821/g.57879 Transcript_19821/m.57879 type:complete len:537 (-) Transcript_19821:22-1632(-)
MLSRSRGLLRTTVNMSGRGSARAASSLASLFFLTRTVIARVASTTTSKFERLSQATLNPSVLEAKYAVRGPVLDRALALKSQLQSNPGSLPFDSVIQCNIGNPQSLGQVPITFHRQVLALTLAPELLSDEAIAKTKTVFMPDAVDRAREYVGAVPSMGAYTHSQGIQLVRQQVANFIEARDQTGDKVNPDHIFLTNGASEGVRICMQTMIRGKGFQDGVLCPLPQYPLYSASCTLMNGELVPYYLDEENEWGMGLGELEAQLAKARSAGTAVRGLVVINPGNPTGQTLSEENMMDVVRFCAKEKLVLFADEVYQENIWRGDRPFHSFRAVARRMGYSDTPDSELQLVSFHSISKGFLGECGIRGGYFELFGFDEDIKAELYKLASISLCSNTPGQVMTGLMVQPPTAGQPAFQGYEAERARILDSLKRRATKVASALNALEGVSCRQSDGALYAFPSISLPQKFADEAAAQGVPPDEWYCLKLVDNTGVVVVPGSGFGQKDGTWHFRTTFLPAEEEIDGVLERLSTFHNNILTEYA